MEPHAGRARPEAQAVAADPETDCRAARRGVLRHALILGKLLGMSSIDEEHVIAVLPE
jgi:hypothetical protein